MKYFRHKVDAHADIKIQQLSREFPYVGYAVFFYLLEMIGREGKDGKLSCSKAIEYATFYFQDKREEVEKVIKKAVEVGLFTIEQDTLFCPKLVNGYSDEWTSRRRRQHMLDILESSGEVKNASTITNKYLETVKEVLSYLNEKTGKQYRWQSRDNQLIITARLREEYTKEDLLKVIDNQCERWLGDEKMEPYLRPITIFGRSKIESYLNAHLGLASKMKDWGKK
ncbi:MAG: conserved phage C-terminal domain-containing protein [Candidatus Omnitrophota bacterium]|nr:conserved phage C-terminal domain-containing protein [Candidatus Omnitrophota bacterium]